MKKKWQFQFGMRLLLIVMAVVAVGITATLALKSQADAKASAFRNIESHGGVFGYNLSSNSLYRRSMSLLGVEERAFWNTNYFIFGPNCDGYDYQNPLDDDQMASISASLTCFQQLEELGFEGCNHVTDTGIEALPLLPNLTTLDVRGTKVSDRAIEKLEQRYPNAEIRR